MSHNSCTNTVLAHGRKADLYCLSSCLEILLLPNNMEDLNKHCDWCAERNKVEEETDDKVFIWRRLTFSCTYIYILFYSLLTQDLDCWLSLTAVYCKKRKTNSLTEEGRDSYLWVYRFYHIQQCAVCESIVSVCVFTGLAKDILPIYCLVTSMVIMLRYLSERNSKCNSLEPISCPPAELTCTFVCVCVCVWRLFYKRLLNTSL